MARDIPFIPRFYIDHMQWLKHSGMDITINAYDGTMTPRLDALAVLRLLNFNPTDNMYFDYYTQLSLLEITQGLVGFSQESGFSKKDDIRGKWYLCSMASNHASSNTHWQVKFTNSDNTAGEYLTPTEIINTFSSSGYDGFNLVEYDVQGADNDDDARFLNFDLSSINSSVDFIDLSVGALSFGKIFDMPISSDVEMTMSYEYGTRSKQTQYGSTITNIDWTSKPTWNGRPAWELYSSIETDTAYKIDEDLAWRKSGRRVYDLAFTFLSSDDMLPTSAILNDSTSMEANQFTGDSTDELSDNGLSLSNNNINIKNDNSFYAQVVHKTMGFALPFIFQPNKNYAKPDGFMFAKIDEKDFALEQLAPDLWRVKMKIKEVW